MNWTKTFVGDAPQRVNKWLAQEGLCSRREAEELIAQGVVSIDGARVQDPGHKIAPGQTLVLTRSAAVHPKLTVVLHKPVGFVSAQPEHGQVPAARLVDKEHLWGDAARVPSRTTSLAPVGRLDLESRGLLLLSEDGVVAKAVIGPVSDMDKEYLVTVAGALTRRKLALLRHGLALDGRQLKPAKVSEIGEGQLRFILREGRNRQIRRMCEAVALEVTDLFRIRIGPLALGDLPEGKWRPLSAAERDNLVRAGKAD
jgi:23S rRNA pseudouridine2604 synthase